MSKIEIKSCGSEICESRAFKSVDILEYFSVCFWIKASFLKYSFILEQVLLKIFSSESCSSGVRNGLRVRVETRDRGIWVWFPVAAGSHFRFGCGVPPILARSLRNGTKNTGGLLYVCTPHMQSKDLPWVADFAGHGYRARLEYHGC